MLPPPLTQTLVIHLDIAGVIEHVGDDQAMREMLLMMAELLATDSAKIASCLQTGDLVHATELLHSLKGCIPIFCTPTIELLLDQTEGSAKRGDLEEANAHFKDLGPALNQLAVEIDHYLVNHANLS